MASVTEPIFSAASFVVKTASLLYVLVFSVFFAISLIVEVISSAAADTILADGIYHRLFDQRVIGKSEVIVAAEVDDISVIDLEFYLLRTLCYPARTVTMLLFELREVLIEVFHYRWLDLHWKYRERTMRKRPDRVR